MIKISLNNDAITTEKMNSLSKLLEEKGYQESYFAVAINNIFIPKSKYAETILNEGDAIDIITPMQGG